MMEAQIGGNGLLKQVAMLFGGSTICAALIYAIAEAIKAEPKLVIQTLANWGPLGVIVILGMVMMNSWATKGVGAIRENTAAQQKLADAVMQIAEKDDRQAEEQRRLLNYVGTQMERILTKLDRVDEGKSRGANA